MTKHRMNLLIVFSGFLLTAVPAFALKWTIQGDYKHDERLNPKYFKGPDFSVNMDLSPYVEKNGSKSKNDFYLKNVDTTPNAKMADEVLSRAFYLDDNFSNRIIASALAELKCDPKKLEVITEIKSVPKARADIRDPNHPAAKDSRRAVSIEFKGCVNPPDEMPEECAVEGVGQGYLENQGLRQIIKLCNSKLRGYAPIKEQFFPNGPHEKKP
jgi:hypothetical protein